MVDLDGRYTGCHHRVWQCLAHTINWSKRVYDGFAHWPTFAQPPHGTKRLARSTKEAHIMDPNHWYTNYAGWSFPDKILVGQRTVFFPH